MSRACIHVWYWAGSAHAFVSSLSFRRDYMRKQASRLVEILARTTGILVSWASLPSWNKHNDNFLGNKALAERSKKWRRPARLTVLAHLKEALNVYLTLTKIATLQDTHSLPIWRAWALFSIMSRWWVVAFSKSSFDAIVASFTAGAPVRPTTPVTVDRSYIR